MSEEKFRQTEGIFQRLLQKRQNSEFPSSSATFDLNELLEKVMTPLQAVNFLAKWVDWRNGETDEQN